ncbi:MAG: helix-turn-helix domain-containing protein [Marvinbryantia sp.]|uniref:helix-turn-helix domain-containing protein n=1 Tax=Marvinbryantia sp. TaxID=2496532 RepID=UPI00399B8A3C
MQGSDIKAYLEEKGIKQNFLAEKSGIPTSVLNLILNNKRKIEANEYMRICESLDLPLDFFKPKSCVPEVKGV